MKILILALICLSWIGCATGPRPPSYKRTYEALNKTGTFDYADKNVRLTYQPTSFSSSVPMQIENKSNQPLKIIWDEVSFINADGTSEKIIHVGVKIADRGASQPPSVIPPLAKLDESVTPISRISWGSSGWDYENICGRVKYANGVVENDEDCIGKTFGIFFVYELNGKKSNFTVKYKLKSREAIPYAYSY